jgi:hypothetical protein
MSIQKKTRKDDLHPSLTKHKTYNASNVIGVWYNCAPESTQIKKLEILQEGDLLYIKIQGSNHPEHIKWAKVEIKPFVSIPDADEISGFTCFHDFGFMETQICSNVKRGILVIQAYNVFKDDSGRPNYFSREFFNQ